VEHYDDHFALTLTEQQKRDLIEYLKSRGKPVFRSVHEPGVYGKRVDILCIYEDA
jgi:hypothetical protein